MKHYFIIILLLLFFATVGYTQQTDNRFFHKFFANRHLSNLLNPTAVNADLLPNSNKTINLGSASNSWKDFYFSGDIYKRGHRFLSTDGPGNLFLGISAGKANIGVQNTAIGDSALYSNTAGIQLTATGYQALFNNTTGVWNGAFGYHALFSNTQGDANFAFGTQALEANTTGYINTAFGGVALLSNTLGNFNNACGVAALLSNTEGSYNVGMGHYALGSNTTGSNNVGVGEDVMGFNTANNFNTAIGHEAGSFNSDYSLTSFDYSYATLLGAYTGADSGLNNITAIGYDARATASNQVMVGNTSVTSIGGYANWSNFSDGRYKKNIKEDVPGLEFITQLRPVTYTLDINKIDNSKKNTLEGKRNFNMPGLTNSISVRDMVDKKSEKQQSQDLKAKHEKASIVYTGFIAQEVEQAAKKLNYNFSGVDAPENEKSFYALRYGDFVVPLVKAVQELAAQNEELKLRLQKLEQSKNGASLPVISSARLEQNAPNPFNKNTVIHYYLPNNTGNTFIKLISSSGQLIKTYSLSVKGKGQLTLNAAELAAGTYQYVLMVDGKVVDSKQMMLTK